MIIWVSSYPKSGNTWVRTFISTYYLSKNDKFNFSMLKNIRQFPHEKFFDKKIRDIKSAITNWDSAQDSINQKNKLIFPGKKKDKSILFDLFYKFNGFQE